MDKSKSFETQCHFVRSIMAQEDYDGERPGDISQILNQRIKKFYATNDYIQVDEEHFKPRAEPLYFPGVEPAADTLVLFGIDFMKKQQLKSYFQGYSPHYLFLDQSNCIITFATAEDAYKAIRANVRQDSNTKFKLEEGAEEVSLGLNLPYVPPRQWIELRPYIYNYKKTKYMAKDFQRRLFVRYATSHEKRVGFNRLSFLQELLARCQLIWESEARKDETLRKYLENKIRGYREAIKVIQRTQERQPTQERSRSRDKIPQRNPNTSRMETNSSKKAPMMEGADEDLSQEIMSRSQNALELHELVQEFQHMNVNQGDVSMIATLKKKAAEADVGYKLLQPAQVRLELKLERFNYRQYVQDSLDKEEKKKIVGFCDLTEDD